MAFLFFTVKLTPVFFDTKISLPVDIKLDWFYCVLKGVNSFCKIKRQT